VYRPDVGGVFVILSRLGRVPALLVSCGVLLIAGLVLLAASHLRGENKPTLSRSILPIPTLDQTHRGPPFSAYDHLPLIFERNEGQTDLQVSFLARGRGYGLYLAANESVLVLRSGGKEGSRQVVRMKLAGAHAVTSPEALDALPGRSNYFIGNDPAKWHRNIPQFARVRYRNVYPGTDLVYYGNHGELEFDFELSPGADPHRIAMTFDGTEDLHVDRGNLILSVAGKEIRLQAPLTYQKIGSVQRTIHSAFKLRNDNEVAFEVGPYDRSRPLTIDPILSYSTYLGGSADESCSVALGYTIPPPSTAAVGSAQGTGCPAIAVDSAQNAYIAGASDSADFPNPTGTSPTLSGGFDVFVAKFNSSGSALLFSTYIGGSSTDTTAGVAVDAGFNVVVAGNTTSSDFPAAGGFQTAPLNSNNHIFVSKLDPSGSVLLYSTYLSGNGIDTATGLALDPAGKGYVTGITTSTDQPSGASAFPATLGALFTTSKYAGGQFFLSVLNFSSTGFGSLVYSTYLGGSTLPSGGTPAIGGGVAIDTSYNAYVTGGTSFTDLPVLNAYQGTSGGGIDVWVAKINFPQNSAQPPTLSYLTYLGGTGDDIGYGVAVDSGQNAYITGSTGSTTFNFTTTSGLTGFQATYGGGTSDAFIAKLGPLCTTDCTITTVPFNYFSYIGGSSADVGLAIAADTAGGARMTGSTNSAAGFPIFNNGGMQSTYGGGAYDAFVARIDTTAATSTAPGHYVSYLGGGGTDIGTGIAVDLYGNSYVTGETSSAAPTPFPTLSAFQGTLSGPTDAFVSKVSPLVNLALTATASPSPVGIGNPVAFTYTITNNGDFLSGVTFTDTLPITGATFASATSTSGSCSGASGGNVTCSLGAISPSATSTVTVNLTPTTGGSLGNSASISVPQAANFVPQTASASAVVSNFTLAVTPASVTVQAGVPATFTAVVAPTGADPDSVSIACSSGTPVGATCTVPNNPIANLNTGAQSRDVIITTTARVTTTTRLWRQPGLLYAAFLPVSGVAFFGFLIGGKESRRRRWIVGLLLAGFLIGMFLQAGCSSTTTTTTTTGTPAGTYIVTITATSGSYSTPASTVTLVVQ